MTHKGLQSKDILTSISDADLRSFLRKEIKRNKLLAIRLAATAIEQIHLEDDNKYDALLGQILRMDTSGRIRITKREQGLLEEVVGQLLKVSDRLIADSAWREAHMLFQPLITRLHQFLDKETAPRPGLVSGLTSSYRRLHLLTQQTLAPELRSDIYSYLTDLLDLSYLRLYDPHHNILVVLLDVMDDLNHPARVLERVAGKIQTGRDASLWCAWYYILLSRTHPEKMVPSPVLSERKYGVVRLLQSLPYAQATALAIEHFHSDPYVTDKHRLEWTEWMFDHARRSRNDKLIVQWGLGLIRQNQDTTVFQEMVEALSETDSMEALAQRILAIGDLSLTGLLYASQNAWPALVELIESRGALEVLTTHLDALAGWNEQRVREIVPQVLMHFVTHHAGIRCGQTVQAFFQKLPESALQDLEQQLRDDLAMAFPGRFPIHTSGLEIS